MDGVPLNKVLEHIPDEARSLTEIRRVLRSGGHDRMREHPVDWQ